jgi:hypothetical protein
MKEKKKWGNFFFKQTIKKNKPRKRQQSFNVLPESLSFYTNKIYSTKKSGMIMLLCKHDKDLSLYFLPIRVIRKWPGIDPLKYHLIRFGNMIS